MVFWIALLALCIVFAWCMYPRHKKQDDSKKLADAPPAPSDLPSGDRIVPVESDHVKKRESPIFPSRLKEGDVVGVISPSSPVMSWENLEKGMDALRKLGLRPKLAPNARKGHKNYMAGTDEERISDFHAMFADPEVKGIFCTGGGHTAMHLLPLIDWELILRNPKIFVGYSDVTSLLLAIRKKTGMIVFHGSAIEELDSDPQLCFQYTEQQTQLGINDPDDAFTVEQFKYMLMDGTIGALSRRSPWKVLRGGEARGHLLGGNFEILTESIGTPYEPDWENAILFWEETEETAATLDHYLWRLRLAGVLKKISGMIVGKVTKFESTEEDNEPPGLGKSPPPEEVILDQTKGFSFPILYGVDFGHNVASVTLPIGADTYLDCSPPFHEGRISILGRYSKE